MTDGETQTRRRPFALALQAFERTATLAIRLIDLHWREKQVLIGTAEGLTDKEIGTQLGISERTVKVYSRRVRDRIGCDNRVQMARYAIREGFIEA